MMVNTLMLVMKDADDTNAEVFYTYQDPVFSEIMQGLLDKYGSDIGEVVFEINGAYIKGDEFIPKKIDYCRIDRNGSIYDKNSIQTGAKDIDDMKADGYEYFGIEDRFLIGDISDNGNFVTYCYNIPAAQKNRMQEMLKDVKIGDPESVGGALRPILSNANIFGSDLYKAGIGEKIEALLAEEMAGPGAVRATLVKYMG